MQYFSPELRFGPEPGQTGPKSSSKFGMEGEPDPKSSLGFGSPPEMVNMFGPSPNVKAGGLGPQHSLVVSPVVSCTCVSKSPKL